MVKIGYLVGSLSSDSINRKLAEVLVSQAPEHVQMVEIPIAELPLYDRHLDANFPQVMTEFKEQVAAVDGLLLVTPEHNQSFPAAVKNAVDILTRGGSSELRGLKLGIAGASPSRFATINSQAQLRQFLPLRGVKLMGTPVLAIQVGEETFGARPEAETLRRAKRYIEAFTSFVES
jgi:chromate reductase, NAD(P)H dehydrogenase (quinone)